MKSFVDCRSDAAVCRGDGVRAAAPRTDRMPRSPRHPAVWMRCLRAFRAVVAGDGCDGSLGTRLPHSGVGCKRGLRRRPASARGCTKGGIAPKRLGWEQIGSGRRRSGLGRRPTKVILSSEWRVACRATLSAIRADWADRALPGGNLKRTRPRGAENRAEGEVPAVRNGACLKEW